MSSTIRVTCPGCHTRFNVSDKFAGKEGPCPKCKKTITIPAKEEEVVIHEQDTGPKDSSGKKLSKPIARAETNLSSVHLVLIIGSILLFFVGALMLRFIGLDEGTQNILLYVGAVIVAIPAAYAAYTFLRNQDAGSFLGSDLWMRVGVCGLIYAALWLFMPLFGYMFPGSEMGSIFAIAGMIAAGAAVGMLALDLDYLMGILHYGMYLGCCLIGRLLVGIDVLPKMAPKNNMQMEPVSLLLEQTQQLVSTLFAMM